MSKLERFAEAYKMMAESGYRPAAPSNGMGTIIVPHAELEVDIEARTYAEHFLVEEKTGTYYAGCTDYASNRAAVLALEAFRLMNVGRFWGSMRRTVQSWSPRCYGKPPRSMSGRFEKSCPIEGGSYL